MSDRIRVIVVTNGYPNPHKPYAGMYVKRHVQLHRQSGLKVTVLDPQDSRKGPVRTPWKYLKLSLRAFKTLVMGEFDLVHAHWPMPAGVLGLALSKSRRRPFVLTSHGSFVEDYESRSALTRLLTRLTLQHADRVIAVGEEHKRCILAVSGLPTDLVTVVDMGVWIDDMIPSQVEARRELGLSNEATVLIFLGNLLQQKGADVLIRALDTLQNRQPGMRLVIGGEGPEETKLRRLVSETGIDDFIKFIGPVHSEDVFRWLAAADICIVPSRTESLGLVALEAMAAGTPVIAADIGGLRQIIRDGENGLLFPVGDHVALAATLERLLIDDDLSHQLSGAGRDTATRYDMRQRAWAVRELYLDLLSSRAER